jgi:nucleotide-binding universal stress UspA family protein
MTVLEEKHHILQEKKSLELKSAIAVKNVLFATDFSETAEAALPYAMAICRRFGSTLHSVHVLSETSTLFMTGGVDYVSASTIYEDAYTDAKERLDQMALRLDGILHRNHVRHGLLWKNLAAVIAENKIDLIVVGTHGRTGLGKLVLGSVAENILRHAPCPVLTIGPKVFGRAKLPAFPRGGRDLVPLELDLRQIVFATNLSTKSAPSAQAAVSIAEEFHARLSLLHVMEDYTQLGRRPGPIEDGMRRLRALLPLNSNLKSTPETVLEFGLPSDRILQVAVEREADLIVLGARTATEVGTTHLPWTTAHHVIANAHCPVLTIRE